jgi:hypothetical protein
MEKSCGECSHSLESETDGQILCIINAPVPIVTIQGQIISVFPSMMAWGKCDNFKKGKTQKMNKQPPEILEPELKVVS